MSRTTLAMLVVVLLMLAPSTLLAQGPRPQELHQLTQEMGVAQLRTPPDGARLQSMNGLALSWDLPAGATQYQLHVYPVNNDGPAIKLIRNAESGFIIPPPPTWYFLLPDMQYGWSVGVTDMTVSIPDDDPSWVWAAEFTFTTPPPSAGSVHPRSPQAAATVTSRTPTFTWSDDNPAIFYYEIQVSRDPLFDGNPGTAVAAVYWNLVHGGKTVPPNSWTAPANYPLEAGCKYFWRVRPRVQGYGAPAAWSSAVTFFAPADPGAPPCEEIGAPQRPALTGKIAFTSTEDGKSQINAMNPDGTGLRRVLTDSWNDTGPSWSPDGARIVFSSDRSSSTGSFDLHTMNADGSGVARLPHQTNRGYEPSWSPDGSKICFNDHFDVRVVNADASNERRLTNLSGPSPSPRGAVSCAWSPDGSRLAFSSKFEDVLYLYIINADGSNARAVPGIVEATGFGSVRHPQWSPDGGRILYEFRRDIFTINPDGTGGTRLTAGGVNSSPVWSPDGTAVAFVSMRDGGQEIYIMGADGSRPTRLTTNAAATSLAWSRK